MYIHKNIQLRDTRWSWPSPFDPNNLLPHYRGQLSYAKEKHLYELS